MKNLKKKIRKYLKKKKSTPVPEIQLTDIRLSELPGFQRAVDSTPEPCINNRFDKLLINIIYE